MLERILVDETEIDLLTLGLPNEEDPEEVEPEETNSAGIPKSKPRNYVDKEELTAALRVWKRQYDENKVAGLEPPRVPEYIGGCILAIATNMASKFNFRGYSFKEDMIGNACVNCLIYLHNFNPDAPTRSGAPNPFWYLSRQCHNVFTKNIEYEARQQYYKYKAFALLSSMTDMLGEEEMADYKDAGGGVAIQEMINDFHTKVSSYEDKQTAKRKKGQVEPEPEIDGEVSEPSPVSGLLEFME